MLSVLTRRGAEEKLEWIFKLYDIDQDGTINEQVLQERLHSSIQTTAYSDTSVFRQILF